MSKRRSTARGALERRARIVVLHFVGCPGTPTTVELIREVVREEGAPAVVSTREVRTPREAKRLRFAGSPTIQVKGSDLFPPPRGTRYGLYCRVYESEGITMSWPSKEAIRTALLHRMEGAAGGERGWPHRQEP